MSPFNLLARHRHRFDRLRRRLVDAGLPPRRAHRLTRELAEHHADIVSNLVGDGAPHHEAVVAADLRLGLEDELFHEILARDEKRSVVKRHPFVAFALGAPVLAGLVIAGTLVLFILAADGMQHLGLARRLAVLPLVDAHYVFTAYLAVPLMSLLMCWTAATHRLHWGWPLVSILLLAVAGGGFLDPQLIPPIAGQPGSGQYALGFHMAGGLHIKSWWRLLSPLAVFSAYLWARGAVHPRQTAL